MGDNERLCAVESRLRLKRSLPQAGLEPDTARYVDLVLNSFIKSVLTGIFQSKSVNPVPKHHGLGKKSKKQYARSICYFVNRERLRGMWTFKPIRGSVQ